MTYLDPVGYKKTRAHQFFPTHNPTFTNDTSKVDIAGDGEPNARRPVTDPYTAGVIQNGLGRIDQLCLVMSS